jgi:hypothetical protein
LLEEAVCRDGTGSGATDDYSLIFLKLRLWVRGLENILSPFSTRVAI